MHSQMYDMMQRMSLKKELSHLLSQNEGRRLEFKSDLPTSAELARTVIAFANDAGGDILIGVNDDRTIAGLPENNLPRLEEQLSNMIYDKCYPAILPEISFMCANGKHLIRIHIYRGSMPPYHLKSEGRLNGTYVRVGSTNRKADAEIISELERARYHVAYDGETVYAKNSRSSTYRVLRNSIKTKPEKNVPPTYFTSWIWCVQNKAMNTLHGL